MINALYEYCEATFRSRRKNKDILFVFDPWLKHIIAEHYWDHKLARRSITFYLNFTPTCSVAMRVLDKFIFLCPTKEVKTFCPTGFVVDTTENSKEGGVAVEVCSSQTGCCTRSKDNILLATKMKTLYFGGDL